MSVHENHESMSKRRRRGLPSKAKAGEMLRHGEVHGKALSPGQRGLFGLIRGGGTPTRMKRRRKRSRHDG